MRGRSQPPVIENARRKEGTCCTAGKMRKLYRQQTPNSPQMGTIIIDAKISLESSCLGRGVALFIPTLLLSSPRTPSWKTSSGGRRSSVRIASCFFFWFFRVTKQYAFSGKCVPHMPSYVLSRLRRRGPLAFGPLAAGEPSSSPPSVLSPLTLLLVASAAEEKCVYA